jgi:exosortase/archaeosortase family protein
MNNSLVVIALQLAAFWSVWRWYAMRAAGSGEDAWGVLALIAALVLCWFKRKEVEKNPSLALPIASTFLYIVTFPFLPQLLRAALAVTTIAVTLSQLFFKKRFHIGLFVLLLLSLPLIASLQFYLGYPLRLIVGYVAAPLLRIGGFAVYAEGSCLNWGGKLIWIDAPCSGIKMLWAGLFLTAVLVCFYELRTMKSLLAFLTAFVVIIIGNIFRALALFYVEAGIIKTPSWMHEGVGVVSFALVGIAIVSFILWLRKEKTWRVSFSM